MDNHYKTVSEQVRSECSRYLHGRIPLLGHHMCSCLKPMRCDFTVLRIIEKEEKHTTETFLIAFESEHHEKFELSPSPLCHQLDRSTQEFHEHSVSHYPATSNYSSRGRIIWFLKNSYCIVALDNHHYKYPEWIKRG